jgi:GntR family carbon starvation induced transcriptional regulator
VGELIDITGDREKPATLASTVYEQLREDILSAILLPGEKLRMEALRERYKIGVSPLREALNRLVMQGLVTQADQKGFRVSSVSVDELQELTRTRRLINEVALRESMLHGDAAWEEGVVLAYHRLLRATTTRISQAERDRMHRDFHRALIAGCGSRQILHFSELLSEQARRYQMLSISKAASPRDGAEEHRLIMEAVVARDAKRAVRLMNDHVNLTEKIVLELNRLPASAEPRLSGRHKAG